MNDKDMLALIRVPRPGAALTYDEIIIDALAVGPPSMATEPILGSKARADAVETAQTLRDFAAEHQRHAARLQQIEANLADTKAGVQQVINDFCDYFSELKAQRDAERQRIAAEEVSRTELRTALDTLPEVLDGPRNEIDDEEPHGELPAPTLEPSLRESDGRLSKAELTIPQI
jgi:hypothetical protein